MFGNSSAKYQQPIYFIGKNKVLNQFILNIPLILLELQSPRINNKVNAFFMTGIGNSFENLALKIAVKCVDKKTYPRTNTEIVSHNPSLTEKLQS